MINCRIFGEGGGLIFIMENIEIAKAIGIFIEKYYDAPSVILPDLSPFVVDFINNVVVDDDSLSKVNDEIYTYKAKANVKLYDKNTVKVLKTVHCELIGNASVVCQTNAIKQAFPYVQNVVLTKIIETNEI